MDCRIVDIGTLSVEDERSWRALAQRSVEPNPFSEPDFLLPSARCFEGFAGTRLVIVHDRDTMRAVLPIVSVRRRRIPPRPVAGTRGYPTAVSGLSTPLVDATCVEPALDALFDALDTTAGRVLGSGIVSFDRLPAGPVATGIERLARRRGLPLHHKDSWSYGAISRAAGWAVPLDGRRRRELGRRRRQLERSVGAELTVVDRSDDVSAVDEFLAMEASGWKGRDAGTAFALDRRKVAWFGEWRRRWAAGGRLLVLSLQAGDVPVAMQWYVRVGDGITCFRIAYDERFARFSPGTILLAAALEFVRDETDAQWLNAYTDRNNRFFLDMLPERHEMTMALVATGGWMDRTAVTMTPALTRAAAAAERARERVLRRGAPAAGPGHAGGSGAGEEGGGGSSPGGPRERGPRRTAA